MSTIHALGRIATDLGDGIEKLKDDATMTDAVSNAGPIFTVVQTIFVIIGIALLIFALFKVVKAFAAGKIGDAVKVGLGGVLAAILCLNLTIPIKLVEGLGGVAEKVVESIGNIAGGAEGDGTPGDANSSTPAAP